ncbi:MAG: hypothetical protein ACUVTF_09650 [bacterium]
MRYLIALILLLLPAIVLGTIIYGGPGDRIRGFAPGDTLVDTLLVTVKVPARIGLYVNGNTEFDLGNPAVTFPPAVYPGYYDPTTVAGTNTDGVDVQVFSNSNAMTWHLQTRGSGDFSATILLDQLFYAPDGEPNPPDGNDPPGGNWQSFTTTYTEIAHGLKTGGWATKNQDYIFQAETDDEPTVAAGATVTIYYRLYAE